MRYETARELVETILDTLDEATSVKRKLSSYKNQSKYMKGKRSAARYPEGHQKKGVSMKTDAVKQLRALIDHHGGQVGVHSQLYNGSMNPEHRAQAYAHNDAKAAAIKAHKALTGKEYFGKKQTNVSPSMMKTDAKHHVRQTSHDGFRW